jgi:hypothetical protein
MSYSQKFKGKLIWGTPVFRILLETEATKLKTDFKGVLTLFERRHEKNKYQFSTLDEFVNTTRELWKETLKAESVQDTRLARWLEEYLHELGIKANYQDIVDAIKGDFISVPALEVGKTESLAQTIVNDLIPPNSEFMAHGSIQRIQGDFDDKDELNKILQNFIEEHRPIRKTNAISKISFVTEDGEERKVEDRKTLKDAPLDDSVNLNSGLINDYGMDLNDITFSDIIPYDYKVQDVKISGIEATKIGEEVTKDGLEVKWHLDKLLPGQKSDIEYSLGKRMLRTILIRDDYDLTILQTYENINKENNTAWVESTFVFQDNTPVVENVKILDQIPGEYKLVDSTPEAVPPLAMVRTTNQATEISWSYTEVPASTQFVLTYELGSSPKIVRDKAQIFNKDDELIAKAVRILRPNQNGQEYGVIMAVKPVQPIDSLSVIDELPDSFDIQQIEVEFGTIAEINEYGSKKIIWRLANPPTDRTIQSVLTYTGGEKFTFEAFSITSTKGLVIREDKEISLKKGEKIRLPDSIYS